MNIKQMTDAELGAAIFPDFGKYGTGDYSPIIEAIGCVLVQCDEDGCQGDTLALVSKDGKYGFVTFGWGSCSGCDALQACTSVEEAGELARQIANNAVWFESLPEAQNFVANRDWEVSYIDKALVADFKQKVEAL